MNYTGNENYRVTGSCFVKVLTEDVEVLITTSIHHTYGGLYTVRTAHVLSLSCSECVSCVDGLSGYANVNVGGPRAHRLGFNSVSRHSARVGSVGR